jgi:3,4-dihydroxy-9,10-secoandrosta-1,3,5(10)-triene-9,17-dione 4,5-dioxygenase
MTGIISHGYIGLTSPDVEEWRAYATSVLGMTVEDGPDEGQILLRMDERSWRISIERGDGGLAFSGWEVASEDALRAIVARLEAAGVATKDDPELAVKRRVRQLVACQDPGGNRIELFYGAFIPKQPFVSPTGAQFVTSHPVHGELGFGHAVVMCPDETEAKKFYLDLLGFRVSDIITVGPATGYFTHVNARHHSLAFVGVPGRPSVLNHIMVEVTDLDTVGRALDQVLDGAAELTLTLGRHSNDHMISFYTKTPSGCMLEYGYAGRLVEDATWTTGVYTTPSYWGHKGGPTAEQMEEAGTIDI